MSVGSSQSAPVLTLTKQNSKTRFRRSFRKVVDKNNNRKEKNRQRKLATIERNKTHLEALDDEEKKNFPLFIVILKPDDFQEPEGIKEKTKVSLQKRKDQWQNMSTKKKIAIGAAAGVAAPVVATGAIATAPAFFLMASGTAAVASPVAAVAGYNSCMKHQRSRADIYERRVKGLEAVLETDPRFTERWKCRIVGDGKLKSIHEGWKVYTVYRRHPLRKNEYIPLNQFHKFLRVDKKCEFLQFAKNLGASHIRIADEKRMEKKATVKGNLVQIIKASSSVKVKQGSEMKIEQDLVMEKRYRKPRFVEQDACWFWEEPTWQEMKKVRTTDYACKRLMVEMCFEHDYGVSANLAASLEGIGLGIGGKFRDFHKMKNVYEVNFFTREDYEQVNKDNFRDWEDLDVEHFFKGIGMEDYLQFWEGKDGLDLYLVTEPGGETLLESFYGMKEQADRLRLLEFLGELKKSGVDCAHPPIYEWEEDHANIKEETKSELFRSNRNMLADSSVNENGEEIEKKEELCLLCKRRFRSYYGHSLRKSTRSKIPALEAAHAHQQQQEEPAVLMLEAPSRDTATLTMADLEASHPNQQQEQEQEQTLHLSDLQIPEKVSAKNSS